MTTITQNVDDIAGVDDNTSWTFYTQQIRESDAGDAIITTHRVRKYPVAGVLTVVLDPGPAVVIAADGKTYPFTVPATDATLWPLIQAAVTIPPTTTHQQLVDAVDAWLAVNANAWDTIPGKPAVVAAGADAAAARAVIGALGTGDIHAAASKTTPVDADELPLADSAASFGLKKLTIANAKAWVKSWIVKADVGLGSADNTSDINKPVSTAQQTALNLKEDLSNKSTTTTLGTSNTLYPTQGAVKAYVDTAVTGVLKDKGVTDASTNPNYPSAVKGDAYIVTVAGKIGGASGKSVDVGDLYFATADNAGGTEASVGTSWAVLEHNLVGALLAGNNLSDLTNAGTARTNLGLGSVTNDAQVKLSMVTTKGDLIAATGSAAVARLAAGANGSELVPDSTTASGLAWIVPRAVNVCSPVYGADPTGSADSTTAIASAIASGHPVYAPEGTYKTTGLTIPQTLPVKFEGAGKRRTTLLNTHATSPTINLTSNGTDFNEGVSIRDMGFTASAVHSGQQAIKAVNLATTFDVSDVYINGYGIGIANEISWAAIYRNIEIIFCTTGFYSNNGGQAAPLNFLNVSIYNATTGFWSEDGLGGFGWYGGTIANCTTGAKMLGFSNTDVGFFNVFFESANSGTPGDNLVLGDSDSGPSKVLFSNCGFKAHITQARSVYMSANAGTVTFDTCSWNDHYTLGIEQAGGILALVNPDFGNTTTHLAKYGVNYMFPFTTTHASSYGFNNGVQRVDSDVTPMVSAVAQTLVAGKRLNVFTATSGTITWTLPPVVSSVGEWTVIKNRGTVALTVSRAGSDQIYDTSAVSTISVAAGASVRLSNDGTYWVTD